MKILIVGDSHTQGFLNPDDPKSDIEYGTKNLDSAHFVRKNEFYLVWKHAKMAWDTNYSEFQIPEEYDVVIIWLGDNDIRNHLYDKGNPDFVAMKLIKHCEKFFGGKTVYFLEPIPQVIECKFPTVGSLEDRIAMASLFSQYLRLFGAKVISYKHILPNDHLDPEDTIDTLHLKKEYMVRILDHIDNMF